MIEVVIVESERGWGRRIDERKKFKTRKAAEAFCRKFNAPNKPGQAPDWYMQAEIVEPMEKP